MKKRMSAMLAVLVAVTLLFAACTKKPERKIKPSEELAKPFESTVEIKYKEIDATAKIAKKAPGYCKVSFESPAELKDISVEFTEGQVSIDYKKLHTSFQPSSLPGSALSKLLVSAIDTATKEQGVRVEYQDGALVVKGQLESGEFTLLLDALNGNLMKLSVPADDFEATFRDFTVIAAE